jgi:hypothetical protein
MIGATIGANLNICELLMLNLSPGTVSCTNIGVNSPIVEENFLSCDKSNVFDDGLFTDTWLNILIV